MLVGLWKNIYTGCTKCHLDLSKVVDHGSEPNNLSVGLRCEHLFQQKCNEPRRRLVKNLLKETQMLDECKKNSYLLLPNWFFCKKWLLINHLLIARLSHNHHNHQFYKTTQLVASNDIFFSPKMPSALLRQGTTDAAKRILNLDVTWITLIIDSFPRKIE